MNTEEIWQTVGESQLTHFLSQGGRMADSILAFDWSRTSIGPIDDWPLSLKSVVQMAVTTRQPVCLFWGKDLNMIYNDAYAPILGKKESGALGAAFEQIWSDVWQDVAPLVKTALSGKSTWTENMPLVMTRNGYEEQTRWSFSYSPLYKEDGTVGGLINITTDTTSIVFQQVELTKSVDEAQKLIEEKNEREKLQRIVQREMAHRIKNILSMTLAVVSQTLRHANSLEAAAETVAKRITALGNAQDILTGTRDDEADIEKIITEVLRPHSFEENRIHVTGQKGVLIPAQAALGLALAIHELATNAIKYGALSNDEGVIGIFWTHSKSGGFRLEWHENGGPPVTPPARNGFGSRLMKRIVPSYFAGTGESFYDPTGFRYVLLGSLIFTGTPEQNPDTAVRAE